MKKLYLISLIAFASSHASPLFWQAENTVQEPLCYVVDLRLDNSAQDFITAIDTMPRFLSIVTQKKLPVAIIAPEDLDGFGPLADNAPALEGARTALAWARSFYQELPERYDMRIIKVPEGLNPKLSEIINFALQQQPVKGSDKTLEEDIITCVHLYDEMALTSKSLEVKLNELGVQYTEPTPLTFSLPTRSQNETEECYLVAGGSGFIGYHIVKTLLEEGHRVIVVDNNACSNPENMDEFLEHPRFTFLHHDITIPFTIEDRIDTVINLASLPSPVFYYARPLETLRTGLQGTINLLKLVHEKHARYVFTSTSEVYGDPLEHPQTETYPGHVHYLGKRAQYDQSKRAAETLLKLVFEADKTRDIRIARLFNTYGPPMMLHDGRVVTNFIGNIIEDKPLIIYGDGTQTRSFGYVEDTIKGIISLVHNKELCNESLITNRVFNLGTPFEVSVNELAKKVDALCYQKYGRNATCTYIPQIDSTDPSKRLPDITRAQKVLGFNPSIELEEGLEKTWAYFAKKV